MRKLLGSLAIRHFSVQVCGILVELADYGFDTQSDFANFKTFVSVHIDTACTYRLTVVNILSGHIWYLREAFFWFPRQLKVAEMDGRASAPPKNEKT